MICWHPLLRRSLIVGVLLAGIAGRPESAEALPGVGVIAGGGVHLANTGLAFDAVGAVDAMGWGLAGLYWTQPSSSTSWLSAGLRKNLSPIPMTTIAPGLGVAMLNSGATSATGPMATLSAGFYPLMVPLALDATVGVAMLNGSLALPYAVGAKLSLFPFTALVARWRGWEGAAGIKNSGPEIGAEIGF